MTLEVTLDGAVPLPNENKFSDEVNTLIWQVLNTKLKITGNAQIVKTYSHQGMKSQNNTVEP